MQDGFRSASRFCGGGFAEQVAGVEEDIDPKSAAAKLGSVPELSLIGQALDCDDPKFRAALANFCRRLVFGRVIPAAYRLQVGELQNGKATRDRPVALKQRIALAPSEIPSTIFGQNLPSQFRIFLLNRLIASGCSPLDDDKGGTALLLGDGLIDTQRRCAESGDQRNDRARAP
jgi:hypothetical protein